MKYTRKKGGVHTNIIPCEDYDTCLDTFLKKENLNLINVLADGNCFFRALTKHLTLSHLKLSDLHLPYDKPDHKILRKIVTDTMKKHGRNVSHVLEYSDKTPLEIIEELAEDGAWYEDSGDIIPQFAARALNITLVIYNMAEPIEGKRVLNKKITCNACLQHYNKDCTKCTKTYRENPYIPGNITVYTFDPDRESHAMIRLLRESNHYKLLYPMEQKESTSKTSQNVNKTRKTSKKVLHPVEQKENSSKKSPNINKTRNTHKSHKSPERNKTLKKEIHKQSRIEEVLANKSITEKQRMAKLRRLGINI